MNALKNIKFVNIQFSNYIFSIQIRRQYCQNYTSIPLRPKKPKAEKDTPQIFVDHFHIETVGGKGGDGCISFLKLWCNDKAGPDGGNGGNGGHVIFKATSNIRDFNNLPKTIKAEDGERGFNKNCCGKSAKHVFLRVPLGTIIRDRNGKIIGDLSTEGAMFIAAKGGAGGRGNHYFVSDTVQSPQVAEFGANGENIKYILEVKSMAHFGLVGMPNAGKSTLLRAISRARPKVAGYAFTTLKPHIGIVQYSDHKQIAVADLPGLVEGSHKNEGLGIEFLKHAERCSGLLFVVDISEKNPIWQYETLRYEISMFSKELSNRPYVVVGNKIDLPEAQENLIKFQSNINFPVIAISAKTGKNVFDLLLLIRKMFDNSLESN